MFPSLSARVPGGAVRGLLLAATVLCVAVPASADVTIREKTSSNGFMGMGNLTGERTIVIAGDRSRTDETSTYTGRFQTMMGGGKPRSSASITRVDREVFWQVDPSKQQYTEMTFAELRQAMEQGMLGAQQEMARNDARHARNVEMTYQVDAKRTGKHDKVNGFDAEEWIVTLTATPKDKDSGKDMGSYTMSMDEWLAASVPGMAETQGFYKALSAKLGLDAQTQGMAAGLMGQYKDGMKQMAEKMREMRGYPVRTTLTIDLAGAAGQMTPEQREKMAKARAEGDRARADHAQDEKAAQAHADESGKGDPRAAMAGALGGMFGHKKKSGDASQDAPGAGPDAGPGGPMTFTTDVISITTGGAGTSFEPPADYKKVERKQH